MRGNGEGKKGEWPLVIKIGEKREGGEKEGVLCRRKGDLKREGKRERRNRERVSYIALDDTNNRRRSPVSTSDFPFSCLFSIPSRDRVLELRRKSEAGDLL